MKYKILFQLALPCLFISNYSFSQVRNMVINNVNTAAYMKQVKATDVAFNDQTKKIESQIREFQKFGSITEKSLPVVFHVIRTDEMEDFSLDLIQTQIDALNRDFSTLEIFEDHPNDPDQKYQSRAAIPMIQFCSPSYDENGDLTIGITDIDAGRKFSDFNAVKFAKTGGVDAWNTEDYVNIWITDLVGNESGFAQMPGGKYYTDGIVIDYKFFGQFESDDNPFNQGKTLTHLMGNYLGLYSLWSDVPCGDDYVEDTPIHNSINYGKPEPGHITLCLGNEREMTMNFMDATYDEGKYMFTQGQVKRMHAVLSKKGLRSGLSNTEITCDKAEITTNVEEQDLNENKLSSIQVDLRPNPASDFVFIDFKNIGSQDYVLYQIVNIKGETLDKGELRSLSTPQTLDTQNISSGLYFLHFTFDAQTLSKKLIID